MRRDHVASTLIRRHFDVVCLLGKILFYSYFLIEYYVLDSCQNRLTEAILTRYTARMFLKAKVLFESNYHVVVSSVGIKRVNCI